MTPPQRWFIRYHGKITEVSVEEYLAAAKRGDCSGETTKDGSVATRDDFERSLSRALGGDCPESSIRWRDVPNLFDEDVA